MQVGTSQSRSYHLIFRAQCRAKSSLKTEATRTHNINISSFPLEENKEIFEISYSKDRNFFLSQILLTIQICLTGEIVYK